MSGGECFEREGVVWEEAKPFLTVGLLRRNPDKSGFRRVSGYR